MPKRLAAALLFVIIGALIMQLNFERVMPGVLRHEGGFANHPQDPGGATMKGVTLATYRRYKPGATVADLKAISNDMLARIYRDGYWNKVRGDDLPDGVDYAVFDFAVNSGPGRAAKYLQAAVGVPQDGVIGPVTLAAVAKANPVSLINSICDARLMFMRRLSTWGTFGKGWSSRVASVRREALRLALDAPKPVPAPVKPPKPQSPPVAPPALPIEPGTVWHVEDKPLVIKPGPAKKPVERNWFWRVLWFVLGLIWKPKEK